MYFPVFYSKNGSLFINSNTVNPQKSKLHRYIIVSNGAYLLVLNNEEQLDNWQYALAVSLGFNIRNNSDDDRNIFVNKVLSIPAYKMKTALQIKIIKH